MIEVLSLIVWPITAIILFRQVEAYLQGRARIQKELAMYALELKNHTATDELRGKIEALDAKIVVVQNGLQWNK